MKYKFLILSILIFSVVVISGCIKQPTKEPSSEPLQELFFYEVSMTFSEKPLLNKTVDMVVTLNPVKDWRNAHIEVFSAEDYIQLLGDTNYTLDLKQNFSTQLRTPVRVVSRGCLSISLKITLVMENVDLGRSFEEKQIHKKYLIVTKEDTKVSDFPERCHFKNQERLKQKGEYPFNEKILQRIWNWISNLFK